MQPPAPISSPFPVWCLAAILLMTGCDLFTDAATRLAHDLEDAATALRQEGDTVTLRHETPSRRGACAGPYTVQLDQVGALVIWCKDGHDEVVASPGTSYHRRFVTTPETYRVEKSAGETLVIELEQRGGEAVIVEVR